MTPFEPSYRLIPLTQGLQTVVDAADYEWLSVWKWRALRSKTAKSFYAARTIYVYENERKKAVVVMMHRLILGIPRGDKRQGDHIETGQTLDNRRSNLRVATRTQNGTNTRRYACNTSGYKGVSWHIAHKKWKASIRVDKKLIHLGYFDTAEKAYAAYCEAARSFFGEFARLV
jgi:hypothetical protein